MSDYVVSIDIGSSKVCTMIGKVGRDSLLDITGKSLQPCNGVKKGIIVDIDGTASSIKKSIEEVEISSGLKVESAYVNIQGMHVSVVNNIVSLNVPGGSREITKKDVENLMQSASDIMVPDDRQLIDVIPKQYILDGYDEIFDPVGMVGTRLEMDADIVAGKITSVQNIVRSMDRAGLRIDGIVAEAFATGEIALTPEEKDIGVMLLDVGGSITDISVFKGKKLVFYDSITIGGDYITNDISIGLKISPSEAEKLKCTYELALTSLIKNDQECTVFDINENRKKSVKVSEIVEIIEARVYEIFSLCKLQAEKAGILMQSLPGGIVLAGAGISYVDGNKELAEEVFNMPVRVAKLNVPGINKPEFMTAAGMIKHVSSIRKGGSSAYEKKLGKTAHDSRKEGIGSKIAGFFRKLF